jgi:hypothetical protein
MAKKIFKNYGIREPEVLSFIDTLSLRIILICSLLWLLAFAVLYAVVPCFAGIQAQLHGVQACQLSSFPLALYASVATMFSLGYADIYPLGGLKLFAGIQVIGGVILNGLAIATIVAFPSNHARLAIRACKGHWVECIDLPGNKRFFSFVSMVSDGRSLIKTGKNYDPKGSMNATHYSGKIITNLFPTLMSIYENDNLSTDYTSGIFIFDMQVNSKGAYRSYHGGCLDKAHGGRDRIFAKRLEDAEFVTAFENGTASEQDFARIVEQLFGMYPAAEPGIPSIIGAGMTTITKDVTSKPSPRNKRGKTAAD